MSPIHTIDNSQNAGGGRLKRIAFFRLDFNGVIVARRRTAVTAVPLAVGQQLQTQIRQRRPFSVDKIL